MKKSDGTIINLAQWFTSPLGQYVHDWESQCLMSLTADIFGFHAVQIGLSSIDTLIDNRMPNKWYVDVEFSASFTKKDQAVSVADFMELPFATQSVDLVVLPHVLEFAKEPHQVLREVERILLPEGQVIIIGFNPVSLFGLRRAIAKVSGGSFLPAEGELFALYRIKDWLKLLSMEVDRGHFGCYAPPFSTSKWIDRFSFMDDVGNKWWPYWAGVYTVQAIKRIHGMHLVGPVWDAKMAKVPKAVPATNKIRRSDK